MSVQSSAYSKDISSSGSASVAEVICKHMVYFNPFDDPKFTTDRFKVELSESNWSKMHNQNNISFYILIDFWSFFEETINR